MFADCGENKIYKLSNLDDRDLTVNYKLIYESLEQHRWATFTLCATLKRV